MARSLPARERVTMWGREVVVLREALPYGFRVRGIRLRVAAMNPNSASPIIARP